MIPMFGIAEPFSSLSHLLSAVMFFGLTFILLKKGWGSKLRVLGLILYSFSLVFLFSMSGVYHIMSLNTSARIVLQRLDHAAIYFLIASSFIPLHLILLRGIWRWGILTLVWSVAITGLVLTTVYFDSTPPYFKPIFFLALGWMGLLSVIKIYKTYGWSILMYLVYGGLAYSVGTILELFHVPNLINSVIGPHEIFHLFVTSGALLQWYFVYLVASHPIHDQLVFVVSERPGLKFFAFSKGESIKCFANSLEELHLNIKKEIDLRFHPNMKPSQVVCQYHKEDVIVLN